MLKQEGKVGRVVARMLKKIECLERELGEEKKKVAQCEMDLAASRKENEEMRAQVNHALEKLQAEVRREKASRIQLEEGVRASEEKVKLVMEENRTREQEVKESVRLQTESFAEKLKKNLTTKPGEVILKRVADMQDRQLNVVFRGLEELTSQEAEERKQHDMERLCSVAVEAGVQEKEFRDSVVRVRRLGKREEGKTHSPLLVRLSSQDLRERLLQGNRFLKQANKDKNTRNRIDPDLTKEQLERLDKMWSEAREKNETKNGYHYYVVGKENPRMRSQKVDQV